VHDRTQTAQAGFGLIELMVTVAIIAVMMSLAVPSFGNAARSSRERSVVQRLVQDFSWARGAAVTGNASILNSAASGAPAVTLKLNANCSWTLSVNNNAVSDHSMALGTLQSTAPNITCSSTIALPATFTFTPQGFVNTTGTVTFTGAGGQAYPLQILYSGTMLRLSPVAGAQS